MTTVRTLGPRFAGYLVSEVGPISRDSGTVAEGESLSAGQIIMLNDEDKIVAHDGLLDTEGAAVANPVLGVIMANVDATTEGAAADVPNVPYTARLAEVRDTDLIYPEDLDGWAGKAAIIADLARNHTIVR